MSLITTTCFHIVSLQNAWEWVCLPPCKDNVHCITGSSFSPFKWLFIKSLTLLNFTHQNLVPLLPPQNSKLPGRLILQITFRLGLWVCCCCALDPHSPVVLLGARIQGRAGQGCWLFIQVLRTMAGWLQRCPANEYKAFYLYSEMWRQMGEGSRGEQQPYTEAQIASY